MRHLPGPLILGKCVHLCGFGAAKLTFSSPLSEAYQFRGPTRATRRAGRPPVDARLEGGESGAVCSLRSL